MHIPRAFPPLQAVIWDMDGTIFDTEKIAVDCWVELCERYGIHDVRSIVLTCVGKNMRDSNAILQTLFKNGRSIEELRAEKNALVAERMREGIPLKDGIAEAIEWIHAKGLPNAIASSSDRTLILSHLETSGLKKYFDVIVGGDEITHGKPHPEIFLIAAEHLKIEPDACIVFEDSHHGIVAAHEAGMRVVMIPDLVETTEEITQQTDYLLTSAKEIIPLLRTISLGMRKKKEA